MPLPRTRLPGRPGWTALAGLAAVLTSLVLVQLPAASAGAPAQAAAIPSPVAQSTDVAPATSAAPSAAPAPAELPNVAAPAAAPAEPVVVPAVPVVRSVAGATPGPAAQAPVAEDLCSGDGWEQRRGAAALSSLEGDAARTGFQVVFKGARSGYLGLTHLPERRIDMHVRSCAKESDDLLRHVMAHELGHAWDTTHMTDASRRAYQAARGIPASTPWYGCSGCTDFATPAGDFAEVYAQWARGATSNRSEIAGDAAPAQLTALASSFFGA